MNETRQVLEASNIHKDFYQGNKVQHVLCGISTIFNEGHSYAITGVSGSGKSTLLHLLGGLDTPTAGRIILNGTPLEQLKKSAKNTTLNQTFGFVFQFHYLIKELSAIENVMIPGLIKGIRRATCRAQAGNLLATVGLSEKEHAYPSQLSGGEQQRVAIARAMFNKPAFLFADEPTGNLDTENAQTVVNLFLQGQQEWNMGIILCSHDPAIYTKMQTIYHLEHGMLTQKNS